MSICPQALDHFTTPLLSPPWSVPHPETLVGRALAPSTTPRTAIWAHINRSSTSSTMMCRTTQGPITKPPLLLPPSRYPRWTPPGPRYPVQHSHCGPRPALAFPSSLDLAAYDSPLYDLASQHPLLRSSPRNARWTPLNPRYPATYKYPGFHQLSGYLARHDLADHSRSHYSSPPPPPLKRRPSFEASTSTLSTPAQASGPPSTSHVPCPCPSAAQTLHHFESPYLSTPWSVPHPEALVGRALPPSITSSTEIAAPITC